MMVICVIYNFYRILVLFTVLCFSIILERNQIQGEPTHYVGQLSLEVGGAGIPNDLVFVAYSDEQSSWSSIYGSSKSCQEKVNLGKHPVIGGLTLPQAGVPVVLKDDPKCKVSPCFIHTEKITQGVRPRFWYAVLARTGDCDSKS